jgi:hypothetical protein
MPSSNGNGSATEDQLRELAIGGAARTKQRRTVSTNDTPRTAGAQVTDLFNQYAPLAYMLPWETLDYVELLATYNPDYCVDEDTEILTRRGWIGHQDLRVGDETLAINPETGLASWQPVEAVNRFPARCREMISIESQTHSSLTTPDHRWLVRDYADRLRWRTSETLTTGDRVPLAAPVEGLPTVPKYDDAFVELVAWFYTEGSWDEEHHWDGQITQSRTENPENVDRIRACLTTLYGSPKKLPPGRNWSGEATWSEADLRELAAFNLTKAILKDFAPVLRGKIPASEFLCSLTRAQLELFIQTSIDADGCRSYGHTSFSQSSCTKKDGSASKLRSDAFQMACALAGYGVSTHPREDNKDLRTTVLRRPHFWPKASTNRGAQAVYKRVHHSGMVWCPSVPYQNWLARRHGSVFFTGNSQAVENVKMLANSGHELFVDGPPRMAKATKDLLENKAQTIQSRHGGIDGLIEKLLDQAATFGAMAGEVIMNDEMTDVVDFVDVNPKTIRFFWEETAGPDTERFPPGRWAPYQKMNAAELEKAKARGQKIRSGCAKLNEVTFQYYAFDAAPGSPYGTPPFLAALSNIAIQRDMVINMAQIVKKLGLLGIIDMVVKSLPMKPGETQAAYESRAGAYLDEYVTVVEDMVKDGGIVHFDDVEAKSYQLTGNAAGATAIFKQNEELIFSGLKSMPSVQGRSYSTTETYAGVAYEIILRNAVRYQRAAKRLIEHIYWMSASLAGLQPDRIRVTFNNNRALFRLQEAQAEKLEIMNAVLLWVIGVLDQDGVAQRVGYDVPKTPLEEVPPSLVAQAKMIMEEHVRKDDLDTNVPTYDNVVREGTDDDEREAERSAELDEAVRERIGAEVGGQAGG